MAGWQERWVNKFYDRSTGWVDGTTQFHELCRDNIPRGARICEIGAGPSNQTSRFLATIGEVHGVDIDASVLNNDALASANVVTGDHFPFEDENIDACVSNYVIEHIENPGQHLREVFRILKPGGVYLFRAPNRNHYVSLVARFTPHWFHERVSNRLRNLAEDAHAPYPTYHRLNSPRQIADAASHCGFSVAQLMLIEKEPSYGMSSKALFLMFLAYERLVNATDALAGLRANILGVLRRP
ncbi:MAG: class I SAM-dependent methyltransferase [Defluviicoccus sp.]|nr:class I SAM-dependent methyltransferase [Defluviicoccus sp.]MDG4608789.1 class I SAM-dependent methyltransferase [Defluviicoccus sp.]